MVVDNLTEEKERGAQFLLPQYVQKWDSRCSIRTRPQKLIDFGLEGYFFPPDKQPLLISETVQEFKQDVKEQILILSFFKYLHDIINLEIALINKVCNDVIYEDLPIPFEEHHRLSAYTILIDEYYHVYLAKLLMNQLNEQFSDIAPSDYPISDSYFSVLEIKKELDVKYHTVFDIIAVCIFETTLVRELVTFFNSSDVHPSIKYYVNDHMNDESRHYGYFHDLLTFTWKHLPEDYRQAIGVKIARFVKLYLNINSDKAFNLSILKTLLEDEEKAQHIINDIYKEFEVSQDIPIVKNVLNVLTQVGMMEHAAIKSGFKEIGWNI